MRKVEIKTTTHPRPLTPQTSVRSDPDVRFQIGAGRGRHCQNKSPRTRAVKKTYVVRSAGSVTIRVQRRLNAGRAMMLCCRANNPNKSPSTINALIPSPTAPLSIDLGTSQSPTNPMV